METKAFGVHITNVAPGDFATDIASRRFHAPVIQDSAYQQVYQQQLDMVNAHVDGGSNPIQMAEAIYQIIQTPQPKIHYKVGAFMQSFLLF